MKKALIISLIVFLVSLVAFGISVAVTGVREGQGFGIHIGNFASGYNFADATKAGDVKTYSFANTVKDIEISTMSARTNVTVSDVSEISVKYSTQTGGQRFYAKLNGDELEVVETGGILFGLFYSENREATLEIILPAKEYTDVEINTASGETDINGLICDEFDSNAASGNSEYNIFAKNISIETASGSVNVINCCPERVADKVKIDSVSGTHTISGFRTNEFKLNNVSGNITASGISGEGAADIVSGEINISYAEWNDDLKLNAVSGKFDITLPENSGVRVDMDSPLSGDVQIALAEADGDVDENRLSGEVNSGNIGGDNVHNVKINLVSGSVDIHN